MSISSVTELVESKVYALHNTFELNSQISAYSENARGSAPASCCLLVDDNTAMLLDTGTNALFSGDGFTYSHYHWGRHCDCVAEEAKSLDLQDVLAVFAERALYWTTTTDMSICVNKLEKLMDGLGVEVVAPTHGLPVTNLAVTMPKVRDGLIAEGDPELTAKKRRRGPIAAAGPWSARTCGVPIDRESIKKEKKPCR